MAPTLRAAVGAACLLRAGDVDVLIDFPAGEVRPYAGEVVRYRFEIERALVESVVAASGRRLEQLAVPVVPLPGVARRRVQRVASTTSSSRCRSSGCAAPRPRPSARLDPPIETEPDIELGDWVVQRRCPHRNADLAVFGEIEDGTLTCTLHGWRFDLETGRCLTAADHPLRVRRRER